MNNIVMYTKDHCPYCVHAKNLLDSKDLTYTEVRVDQDQNALAKMMELTNARTVPQIIINDKPIGGFDSLKELELTGQLDDLLKE